MATINQRTADGLLSILDGNHFRLSVPYQGINDIWLRGDEFIADRQGYSNAPPIVVSAREVEECVRFSMQTEDEITRRKVGPVKELEAIAYRLKRAVKSGDE